jgi:hypothetical protein
LHQAAAGAVEVFKLPVYIEDNHFKQIQKFAQFFFVLGLPVPYPGMKMFKPDKQGVLVQHG